MTRRSIAVDEFLGDYSPVVRETAHAARRVVLAALPEAHEAVISGWRLIGYRVPAGKGSAYVGYLAPLADEVRLGFEWGVYLDDPNGVLAGAERRYVTCPSHRRTMCARSCLSPCCKTQPSWRCFPGPYG